MIRPIISIFILLFFVSCIEESPIDTPKKAPLSEQEFKDVLMEIYLINAYITNNNKQGEIHCPTKVAGRGKLLLLVRCPRRVPTAPYDP